MPSETTRKGELACLKVQQRAIEQQAVVSKPTIECEYDFVIDWKGKLYRTQVKYASCGSTNADGVVQATVGKADGTSKRHVPYSANDIDALAIYIPQIDKVCWFESGEWLGKTRLHLRYEPCKNGQTKGCRLVDNFIW